MDMADLSECTSRVQATVSACLKRVGMDEASAGGSEAASGSPMPSGSSVLGRLGSRLASTVSSGGGAKGKDGDDGGAVAIQFGGGEGGGGAGLYLSSD